MFSQSLVVWRVCNYPAQRINGCGLERNSTLEAVAKGQRKRRPHANGVERCCSDWKQVPVCGQAGGYRVHMTTGSI